MYSRLCRAASVCNRRPAKKQGRRLSALYAQHKINTDIVTVFIRRGREVFTRRFGGVILSSRIDAIDTCVKLPPNTGSGFSIEWGVREKFEHWPDGSSF